MRARLLTRAVLVVDDDPAILALLRDALELEGYDVDTATDGRKALARLGQSHPSVVLLDMQMPLLDGWGFAAALATQGQVVPIIIMTAGGDANARRWAADLGAVAHLAKPFGLDELLTLVDEACAQQTGTSV